MAWLRRLRGWLWRGRGRRRRGQWAGHHGLRTCLTQRATHAIQPGGKAAHRWRRTATSSSSPRPLSSQPARRTPAAAAGRRRGRVGADGLDVKVSVRVLVKVLAGAAWGGRRRGGRTRRAGGAGRGTSRRQCTRFSGPGMPRTWPHHGGAKGCGSHGMRGKLPRHRFYEQQRGAQDCLALTAAG